MHEKSWFEYHPIGIWILGGILFGLYVSFWFIIINNLYLIPTDAGLIVLYLLLTYSAISLIIYSLIHLTLAGIYRLPILKGTFINKGTIHQTICLWFILFFTIRFLYRVIFGYPIGMLKVTYDLFFLLGLASISWFIIRQYNLCSRRIKWYILSIIYIFAIGIGIGVFSIFRYEFQHQSFHTATTAISPHKSKLKLLVIGFDGADWKVLNSLVQQHKLPQFAYLISTGVSGKIKTLHPTMSPLIWTSIATGKLPYKHGVYSHVTLIIPGIKTPIAQFDSLGLKWVWKSLIVLDLIRQIPVTTTSIHTATIWDILGAHGNRIGLVGWWPSWPIEPEHKEFVVADNILHTFRPNSVYPVYLESTVKQFRIDAGRLDFQAVQRFITLDSTTFSQFLDKQVKVPYLDTLFKEYGYSII
ncbi:MAG: alkaline phosphatase family protein [bacterium]